MHESTLVELERLCLALGDKTRLRLLALMANGPVAVGFLADRLNESQPKVSRHLAYLRNAGVVSTRRDGKWIYYGIEYSTNSSLGRILDTVIQSIAATRVDVEYVHFSKEAGFAEQSIDPATDIYAEAYESEHYDADMGDQAEEFATGQERDDDMDVFLL